MSDAANHHRGAAVRRVLGDDGRASVDDRRAAFANTAVPEPARALVDKVARHAYKVTDEDIAAAKTAGLTEDQIFELCVCAAMGQATRQLDAAFAALDAADAKAEA
jgi:alkylhydroperoxidase family enzyme